MNDEIRTIDREELKTKLDRGDDFKLIMTLHDWAFRAQHIPGSIHYHTVEAALEALTDKDEEIVVYCSDVACVASRLAYRGLVEEGFTNVRRYSGGLSDWGEAGYPFESGEI